MAVKIIRNDIAEMACDAIVNTANAEPVIGAGCDYAIYNAAGKEVLLKYRKEKIGERKEGEVFVTPGFHLPAKQIIHVVSPMFVDGEHGEEEKLRTCYQKSLDLALALGIHSIAFPLISSGSFGYLKEEAFRIALEELESFSKKEEMEIYLVIFDKASVVASRKLTNALAQYIDDHYVEKTLEFEYFESSNAIDERNFDRSSRYFN